MKYFTKDFLKFFEELESNNNKAWFNENRSNYEIAVRDTFKTFVKDLTNHLQQFYPFVDLSDKTSISRINRDIRFGKDKTPYKTHISCMIMPFGKKDRSKPGFYLQANHKDIRVYSGAHDLSKEMLQDVKNHIASNLAEFQSIINEKNFRKIFGEVQGEKYKRIPSDLRSIAEKEPLISNKNFYWFFKLDPSQITSDSLINEVVERFKFAMPLNNFFSEALSIS